MRALVAAALTLFMLGLATCTGDAPTDPDLVLPPVAIQIVSGNLQTGVAEAELEQPLVVLLTDERGHAVRGHVINFKVSEGGGSFWAGTHMTDKKGRAQDYWTLGPSGAQVAEVRAVDPETGEKLVYETFTATIIFPDLDEDGFTADVDCDDTDPSVYPGATEVENGKDDDCDGVTDEGFGGGDDDADGDGYTIADGDCDDGDATVYPGAFEVTDGIDNDCDGIVDEDTSGEDSDGDGLTDGEEAALGTDPANADTDGDGLRDGVEWLETPRTDPNDPDTDNDGLDDRIEIFLADQVDGPREVVLDADWDDDGLSDGFELLGADGVLDPVLDGEDERGNPVLFDTDEDGVSDGVELGVTEPIPNGTSDGGPSAVAILGSNPAVFIADADPSTLTDPWRPDSDGDGLPEGAEDLNRNGAFEPELYETDPTDPDTDGDGFTDSHEGGAGPTAPDEDGDGIIKALDPDEGPPANTPPSGGDVSIDPTIATTLDDLYCRATGFIDLESPDLTYVFEWILNGVTDASVAGQTLPRTLTTKGDQIACRARAFDGEFYSDWVTSQLLVIQNAPPQISEASVDLTPDYGGSWTCSATASDPDGDPLTLTYQWLLDGLFVGSPEGYPENVYPFADVQAGAELACVPSVSDGIQEAEGPAIAVTWDDTDQDGLLDGTEYGLGTDPFDPDTDADGLFDGEEVEWGLDPLNPDTDGDGLTDGQEYDRGEGLFTSDPTNPDTDDDGLSDGEEVAAGTDPLNADSDNDGLPDWIEGDVDSDGDGTPNYRDTDSDGDGLLDQDEGVAHADGDGIPNYLDLDSDDDGIPDSVEGLVDTDMDGRPNYMDEDSDDDGLPDFLEGTADDDGDGIPNYLDPATTAVNLLVNPGVEEWSTAGPPLGWTVFPTDRTNFARVQTGETLYNSTDVFQAFEGASALKLWGTFDGGENDTPVYQEFAAAPGEAYEMSAWAYMHGADPITAGDTYLVLRLKFYNDDYSAFTYQDSGVITASSVTNAWTELVVAGVVPDGFTKIQASVSFTQCAGQTSACFTGGSVYVDDVTLTRIN